MNGCEPSLVEGAPEVAGGDLNSRAREHLAKMSAEERQALKDEHRRLFRSALADWQGAFRQ